MRRRTMSGIAQRVRASGKTGAGWTMSANGGTPRAGRRSLVRQETPMPAGIAKQWMQARGRASLRSARGVAQRAHGMGDADFGDAYRHRTAFRAASCGDGGARIRRGVIARRMRGGGRRSGRCRWRSYRRWTDASSPTKRTDVQGRPTKGRAAKRTTTSWIQEGGACSPTVRRCPRGLWDGSGGRAAARCIGRSGRKRGVARAHAREARGPCGIRASHVRPTERRARART